MIHRPLSRLAALLLPAAFLSFALSPARAGETTSPRRNVLFIAIDDLRPEIGCYGAGHMKTPNLDALARRGTVFRRAYCQQAVCAPSRASLLTGRRPDSTGVFDLRTHFRKRLPDAITLPQLFVRHGWHAAAMGKIYHPGLDDEPSWSEPVYLPGRPVWGTSATLEAIRAEEVRQQEARARNDRSVVRAAPLRPGVARYHPGRRQVRGPSWEMAEFAEEDLDDGATARHAVETLRHLKREGKPFFLAVGFARPHLPFVAPKKYFDLYPPESIRLPEAGQRPAGAPPFALEDFGELRTYADIPSSGPLPEAKARELIRAYCASVSFMDAQLGRVLDELDRLGLRDSTVVVAWGDHGWHLGDLGHWCKHTNFEVATRSPLIVAAPGQKAPGRHSDALIEFVDVYPTVAELCGVPVPEEIEGRSFAPLLDDPDLPWKEAALSQYPRRRGTLMGYSIRTERHRYTEWLPWNREKGVLSLEPEAVELYDHAADPSETVNVAQRPENAELIRNLSRTLHRTARLSGADFPARASFSPGGNGDD